MKSNCPDCGRFGKSLAVTLTLHPTDPGRIETFLCGSCGCRWIDGQTGVGKVVAGDS